jgi:hypothetical protein
MGNAPPAADFGKRSRFRERVSGEDERADATDRRQFGRHTSFIFESLRKSCKR